MYIVYRNKTLDSDEHVPNYEDIVGIFKSWESAWEYGMDNINYTVKSIVSDF